MSIQAKFGDLVCTASTKSAHHYSELATRISENIAVENFLKCKSQPSIYDYGLK